MVLVWGLLWWRMITLSVWICDMDAYMYNWIILNIFIYIYIYTCCWKHLFNAHKQPRLISDGYDNFNCGCKRRDSPLPINTITYLLEPICIRMPLLNAKCYESKVFAITKTIINNMGIPWCSCTMVLPIYSLIQFI